MVTTPTLLDRAEVAFHSDGRREVRYPGAAEELKAGDEWAATWKRHNEAEQEERGHAAAATARVREVIAAGPPVEGTNTPLARHLVWIEVATRRCASAEARRGEAQAAAERHAAAIASRVKVTGEVREDAERWAAYATGPEVDAERSPPDMRRPELDRLAGEIAATSLLASVSVAAAFEAKFAAGVVTALELLLKAASERGIDRVRGASLD